jgi:Zn finger protein HypA/HybF involved in hydrogenase expression
VHELAVAQAIVAAAECHAEWRPVSMVRVHVGRLGQVVSRLRLSKP